MADLTPSQLQTRERIEALISLMAPALNVILSVGDRVSRIVEPEDHDYYPARPLVQAPGKGTKAADKTLPRNGA